MAGNGELGDGEALEGGAGALRGPGSRRAKRSDAPAPAKTQRTGFRQFVRECIAELGKVQWPTRRHLWQASAVVVVVTVVLGVYIALLDSALTRIASWLIDQYALPLIMFRWYVINTYSGHENKVRQNLLHRVESMSQQDKIRRVVVPTEKAVETKDGQKIEVEKRVLPGYVLVQMEMTDDSWHVVKNTPGVTGFVGGVGHGAERQRPTALSELEVNRLLHTATTDAAKPKSRAEFSLGEMVKVTSGALSDFEGEITEVNAEAGRLKVSVSIFERQVPVELAFEDVKKID